jgi:DNA sulfur modification protein DndC
MARQRVLYEVSKRKKHRKTGQFTMRINKPKAEKQKVASASTPATSDGIYSAFDERSLAQQILDIQTVYLQSTTPWVVMTSLGKDSTAMLQLIWIAIESLPAELRKNHIYVVAGDTLIELPAFAARIDSMLALINASAHMKGLPITAHKTIPAVNDRMWTCVAGRGYGMPTARFRWCTGRLKSTPNERFVKDHIAKNGQVIMTLGVRLAESATRAASIEKHRINSTFSRSATLPGALVYTPIANWTTDDVWTYLLQVESPWGASNRDLLALYRQASAAGECPIVVGNIGKGQACGNSRFGCFPCTVSSSNRSLRNMVDQEEWLESLWDIYEWLRETTRPERKLEFRDVNTTPAILAQKKQRQDGSAIPGRYKLEFRKELVRRLLEAQRDLRRDSPYPELSLIDEEQLRAIRFIWFSEGLDDGKYIPEMYREITGIELDCATDPADDAYLLEKPMQLTQISQAGFQFSLELI